MDDLAQRHPGADSKRYLAFIAANPGWPSVGMFRKRAEAMLWVENIKPAQALSFFKDSPPQTGTGRLVLARALIAQGDAEAAKGSFVRRGATIRSRPRSRSRRSIVIPSS